MGGEWDGFLKKCGRATTGPLTSTDIVVDVAVEKEAQAHLGQEDKLVMLVGKMSVEEGDGIEVGEVERSSKARVGGVGELGGALSNGVA